MSEQSVTYVDLRFHPPTEQKRKRRPERTRVTAEISEQEVTYSDLKFHAPSKQQRQQTPSSAESKESISPSSPRLIAVILGLVCLALLAATAALGVMFLQASEQVRKQNEEFIQKQDIFSQNFSQLQETLKNCSQQRDDLQAQKANFSKLADRTGDNCSSCPESWIQLRGKCYHFTNERRTWQQSKEYCLSHGSKLLKIENKEELNFINGLVYFHWIGLSRKGAATSWMWEDSTAPSTVLLTVKKEKPGESCALLNAGEAVSYDCGTKYRSICEKGTA